MITTQPGNATQSQNTVESLRAQIDALQLSINEASERYKEAQARLNAATAPSERVLIRNRDMRPIDGEISRLTSQKGRLEAELRILEARVANPPAQPVASPPVQSAPPPLPAPVGTATPPASGLDLNSMVAGGAATVLVLVPLFLLIVWRVGRRAALKAWRAEMQEDGARLTKVEEALSSVVLEVERVSESQRFLTNTLVGDARQSVAKETVVTRS